jgi:hypothetical protein
MSTTPIEQPQDRLRVLFVYLPIEPRLIGMPSRVRLGEEAAAVLFAALVAALQQGLAWPVDAEGRDLRTP